MQGGEAEIVTEISAQTNCQLTDSTITVSVGETGEMRNIVFAQNNSARMFDH
jgi:hypothetical protein